LSRIAQTRGESLAAVTPATVNPDCSGAVKRTTDAKMIRGYQALEGSPKVSHL